MKTITNEADTLNPQMAQMDADGERDKQTHVVIGAAMTVHSELGHGFLEPVYQEALEHELVERAIPYERERALPLLVSWQASHDHLPGGFRLL